MTITRSYNKNNGIYYAYETSYVWDEDRQKKVQKKVCIGHFDPETDEILPNAKRGRPRKKISNTDSLPVKQEQTAPSPVEEALPDISTRLAEMKKTVSALTDQLRALDAEITGLINSTK